MKKVLLTSILLSSTIFASEGYEIYKKNCASCHIEMISKKDFVKNISKVKAPPMIEVSNQLKKNIKTTDEEDEVDRHLFILFVKDYIINPDLDFSMCRAGALDKFGTMPSLKKKITPKEAKQVAEWLYDRYEGVEFK